MTKRKQMKTNIKVIKFIIALVILIIPISIITLEVDHYSHKQLSNNTLIIDIYNLGYQDASSQFANYTQLGYNLALERLNNDMVNALSNYGQYRTNIIYQNQSIPIYCKVVGQ